MIIGRDKMEESEDIKQGRINFWIKLYELTGVVQRILNYFESRKRT
jgi:hypothetical protein